MARVVPSQVRTLLEELFPAVLEDVEDVYADQSHTSLIRAIVTLTREIPSELLALSAHDYSDFVLGLSALQTAVDNWPNHPSRLRKVRDTSALILLHRLLGKCPDEFPAANVSVLSFITDSALRATVRQDIGAAHHDLVNGEFKGATVLAGAAAEALLLWAIQQRNAMDVGKALDAAIQVGRLTKPGSSNPEHWGLNEYIEVAVELGVIDKVTADQLRIAKGFRNLIHPGRAARLGQRCDLGTAHSAIAGVELLVRDMT